MNTHTHTIDQWPMADKRANIPHNHCFHNLWIVVVCRWFDHWSKKKEELTTNKEKKNRIAGTFRHKWINVKKYPFNSIQFFWIKLNKTKKHSSSIWIQFDITMDTKYWILFNKIRFKNYWLMMMDSFLLLLLLLLVRKSQCPGHTHIQLDTHSRWTMKKTNRNYWIK